MSVINQSDYRITQISAELRSEGQFSPMVELSGLVGSVFEVKAVAQAPASQWPLRYRMRFILIASLASWAVIGWGIAHFFIK